MFDVDLEDEEPVNVWAVRNRWMNGDSLQEALRREEEKEPESKDEPTHEDIKVVGVFQEIKDL